MPDDTPFRLRMNCIHMAKDILSEKMHMTKEVKGPSNTPAYTTDDVLQEAAKLYKFVCDRDAGKTWSLDDKRRLQGPNEKIKAD